MSDENDRRPLTWAVTPGLANGRDGSMEGPSVRAREEPLLVGSEDEVRLAVPAKPEFLGLARVTAAGLASRLGFTFDQVEDLRLAIDEICFGLTGSKGRDGILEVHFFLSPEGLTVRGEGHFIAPGPVQLSELSEVILDALVDEHSISDGPGGPHFLLVKKREPKKSSDNDKLPGEGQ